MADTTFIKKTIEPHVRNWLSERFGVSFHERALTLAGGGNHRFDAVAMNDSSPIIAANILSNRPKTASGNENTGGVRKALVDASNFARLPREVKRILVFTDAEFLELIRRRAQAKGIGDIEYLYCQLPHNLESKLLDVLDSARREQRSA